MLTLAPFVYPLQFSYYAPSNSAEINKIEQYSFIQNDNLHSDTLIVGYITNKTIAKSIQKPLEIHFASLEGDRFLEIQIINISVCDGYMGVYSGDFKNIFTLCDTNIKFNYTTKINSIKLYLYINLSNIDKTSFYVKINYISKNFVKFNGNYEIGWLKNEIDPRIIFTRTLMLPSSNSVIESWNNFEIIRTGENGEWILESKNYGDSIVWYRDYKKEQSERTTRDILIIFISLALSIIIQLLFPENSSKRSKNLLFICLTSMLIYTLILLFNLNHPNILFFSFFFSFIFLIFALNSRTNDLKGESHKKQINDIAKFLIKNHLIQMIFIFLILILIILSKIFE